MVFADYLHEGYIPFLIILGSSLLFGFILDRFVLRIFLNRFKEKDSIAQVVLCVLRGKVTFIVFFIGLYIALEISPLSPIAIKYTASVCVIILIMLFTRVFSQIVINAIKNANEDTTGAVKTYSIIINLVRIVFFCIGLLIILRTLDISITPMLTALGVASLAVALALQDTLGNLFSGISVIAGKRLKPGSYVKLESGQEGIIEDISWRSTVLRESNANRIIVPNQKIASAIITNYSLTEEHILVKLPVGIAYGSDLELVTRAVLEEAVKVQDEVLGEKEYFEPVFRYTAFNPSSINFVIIAKAPDYNRQFVLTDKLIRAIHKRFILEKIDIPFPVQTVILKKEDQNN
ncbi:MAG: mechanosensitive ion channel family protein [Cytophaga sp.]|uniref:mechanosensitive ion channel family protein n=1 Tax=Cytophaga sp. TaxID=29535 RepID=UPI003F7EBC55